MKKLSKYVGILALLGSSVSYGATVTFSVTENSGVANDGIIQNIGDSFSILMSGSGFPATAGASLLLTFDNAVATLNSPVATNGIVVAPGAPFAAGVLTSGGVSPLFFSFLAPTTGDLPSGDFAAVVFNFTAAGAGSLNFAVGEDGGQADGWPAEDFSPIPVDYINSGANVSVVPLPASVWLLGTALGLVGIRANAKRRKTA